MARLIVKKTTHCRSERRRLENYSEWYKQLTSRVKWNGHFSRAFTDEQGVRQRGYCHLYFTGFFINPLLKCLEEHKIGYKIGSIHVGTPTCADGVLFISKSLYELQTMLLMVYCY